MAAHKPIVSTPIKDVVDLYGSVVRIAATPEEVVEQVEAGLRETAGERAERVDRKSTRLNSSHANISYAVFCLKKKNTTKENAVGVFIDKMVGEEEELEFDMIEDRVEYKCFAVGGGSED